MAQTKSGLFVHLPADRPCPKNSTTPEDSYFVLSGTSVVAPAVSGTVALSA